MQLGLPICDTEARAPARGEGLPVRACMEYRTMLTPNLARRPPFLVRFARSLPKCPTTWRYDEEQQLNLLPDGTVAVEGADGAILVKTQFVRGED